SICKSLDLKEEFKETTARFYDLFACDHANAIVELVRKEARNGHLDPEIQKRIEALNDYPNTRCGPPEKFREILAPVGNLNPRIQDGCRSHIDVGPWRHGVPGCPVMRVSRLTGSRHSGIRVFSHAPPMPEGSPHASIAEPCLLVQ